MVLGRFTIEQLSEGPFRQYRDGTYQKVITINDENDDIDGDLGPQIPDIVGINPILIMYDSVNIMLDTGLGWGLDAGSNFKNASNVKTNLAIFDKKPEDITHVIISHLHYDHSAGCTYTDAEVKTRATFPNAEYYVHKKEWNYALRLQDENNQAEGIGYHMDEFYRLAADNRITFIEEDMIELFEGLKIIRTGGHTPGHQIVIVTDEAHSAYYLGDLLPNEDHLNRNYRQNSEHYPYRTKKMKTRLMRQAYREKAYLLFYHSLFSKVGRLEKDDEKNYVLKE